MKDNNIKESQIKILTDLKNEYQSSYSASILNMTKAILVEVDKEINKDKKSK
jgi:hypothetical protein